MGLQMRSSNGLIILFCLMLAACGSAPGKPNLRTEHANKLSARADSAFLQGEYERARDDYLQALRIHESVENVDGMAVLHINLARVFRELAQPGQAHRYLDTLFSEPQLPYPPDTLALAAALKSQLCLEGKDSDEALVWIEKAEAHCRNRCQAAGSLLLLRAQLAQRDNQLDEALKFANDAAAALDSGAQQVELANARRLSGEISLAKNDPARAIHAFQQAYAIDQRTGIPGKIRLDLLRLGAAHERAGAPKTALHFYARALSVSEAMGNAQGAEEVRTRMNGLRKEDVASAGSK